ncbi:Tryptophan synthase alpha chain [Candidatus Vidania fulgoroideae]|nr:Tryptophan synthase alpha chain [Candidatus Vidania fulgoroideae]
MKKIVFTFIPFFPSKKTFYKYVSSIRKEGFNSIEICLSNSPFLDGKTISNAFSKVKKNSLSTNDFEKVFIFLKKEKFKKVFLVFDSSYLLKRKFLNLINRKKFSSFFYIIPDIDKNDNFYKKNKRKIFLLISYKNIKNYINKNGLFYVMNSTKTGEENINYKNKIYEKKRKKKSSFLIGFGISKIKTINYFNKFFDFIIIGTRIIKTMNKKKKFISYIKNVKNKINKNRK